MLTFSLSLTLPDDATLEDISKALKDEARKLSYWGDSQLWTSTIYGENNRVIGHYATKKEP